MIDQDFTARRRLHESVPCNPLPAGTAPDPTLNCLDGMQSSYMMPEVEDDGTAEVCEMYYTDTCYDVEYEDYVYDDYDAEPEGMLPPMPVRAVERTGEPTTRDTSTAYVVLSTQHDAPRLCSPAVKLGASPDDPCMKMCFVVCTYEHW